jgi:hypothetical protein
MKLRAIETEMKKSNIAFPSTAGAADNVVWMTYFCLHVVLNSA